MASITFGGLVSGLDTRALIDAILEAEREPAKALAGRRDLFSRRRSALDELGGKLGAFETALRDLSSVRTFRGRTTTASDETVVRATASTGAELGLFNLEVTALAAAHKVKSEGLAALDQPLVTDGTITIQSGDNDAITIDVSAATFNNTLEAVRDEINAADAGVQASIIFDGTAYRLTVRAEESGLDNALTITDATNLGLDEAANVVVAAADAELTVDGIEVTSSSNHVTGVIPGITLDLLTTTGATPVTVEVAQDADAVVEAAQELVSQYNTLVDYFNAQTATASPGPLAGDATLRAVQLKVQSLFTRGVEGIAIGEIRSLASLGVSFDGKTGKATLDTAELRERLDASFDEVGDVFLSSGETTHPRVRFAGATGDTVSGTYAVQVTAAAEQASLLGSNPISALAQDETLTITVGGETTTIDLLQGATIDDIVTALNDGLDAAGVEATATNDGGRLRISADDFGSGVTLSVASSLDDPGNGAQSGFDDTAATDSGSDVAGTIGGVAASGDGQLLIAAADGDHAGLVVTVTATAAEVTATAGDFGEVSYSRGLIDSLLREVDQLTRLNSGAIDLAREGLDQDIRRLDGDLQRFEERLAMREARLIRTFSAAEQAISVLQAQQARLQSAL
jgi:flagellar hook-associated protein 2